MTDDRPLVSVLVPVLDEEAGIEATVATMRAQDVPGGHEMLFIDGGSRDRTRPILEVLAREDHRVRVFDNPARRVPQALNIGLREARGDFVARMDAHAYYPPGYLAYGVDRLRRGGVDWVAGPQLPRGEGRWSRRVELALGSRLGAGGAGFRRLPDSEIETDSGFLGVWRRELLEELGGWDEQWPVNQDSELAARISARGGRIVCVPEMAADYVPRGSLRALVRQYWRYGQYRAKTSGRHPHSMRRSHVLPPALVGALMSALLPGRAGGPSRAVAVAYACALVASGAAATGRARPRRDAAFLPVVLVAMHLPWGAGFVVGSIRFGVPLAAFVRIARGRD
jgi:cellulose synthase/poly-beta-1,6-N-acetylglucosamine synthase-like glycosyltransferase